MIGRGAAAALLALTACGPVSVEQAERQCLGRAYSTTGPHGEMGVGVNSEGNALARFKMGVTSDYLMGRDPSAVFDQCVFQKSGQPPSQPLYSRSDWKG